MKKISFLAISVICVAILTGCVNHSNVDFEKENKITVAKAQGELQKGMSSGKVLEIMGSPNIISTNDEGNEVWVYDKISTKNESSRIGTGFIPALLIGVNSNSSQTSQKTLTIIVKFDSNKKIKDIAYHTSSF